MKKLGLICGLGPETTVSYYQSIIKAFTPLYEEVGYPEISLESCNLKEFIDAVSNNEWDHLVELFRTKISALATSGAEFAAIASNTPHLLFDRIQEQSPIELVSIVTSTAQEIQRRGLSKVLLMGTGFTMRSDFYAKELAKYHIKTIVPSERDIAYIHEKLFTEIEHGIFTQETRNGLAGIISKSVEEDAIDGVIMGCTELPLILQESDVTVSYINTTDIHINALIKKIKE